MPRLPQGLLSVRECAALAAALVAVSLGVSTRAQTRPVVDAPGTWKAWKFTAVPSARKERAASVAEVRAFEAQLLALNAILQRAPGVATPRGFSVETWGHVSGYRAPAPGQPPGSALPLAGALDFGAFPIFEYERNGKTIERTRAKRRSSSSRSISSTPASSRATGCPTGSAPTPTRF